LTNGLIDHLYTTLESTINYSTVANLCTLQIITARAKPLPAFYVLTSRSLSTGFDSFPQVGSPVTAARAELLSDVNSTIEPSLLSRLCRAQLNCHPSTNWIALVLFFKTTLSEPRRKHRSSIANCMCVSAGLCLPSRCTETAMCLFAYCIATAILVFCFEVIARQRVYIPHCSIVLDDAF
jgi:hypothetical protein